MNTVLRFQIAGYFMLPSTNGKKYVTILISLIYFGFLLRFAHIVIVLLRFYTVC